MQTSIQVACRHNAILARLKDYGYISTGDLASELDVSVHTIRRDLNILESQHRLRRCHGGAGELSKEDDRRNAGIAEQVIAIAKAIVADVSAGSCLYVDSPSMGEILVGLLPEEVCYLVTQHMELIAVAQKNPFISIFFLGRELSPGGDDASIQMSMAKRLPRSVDYCILEVDHIDSDGILFDDCFQQASVKRHFLQRSQRQYVLCRQPAGVFHSLVKIGAADHHKRVFWLTQQAGSRGIGEGL
ncbi:DeoR family transcriptional regulator [Serratia sp. L9]|uniref:DeoR family transcriptional regulator n=1 Tax=Serratia sp. L9 TaxID=3423946 RepID=UPI003D6670F4